MKKKIDKLRLLQLIEFSFLFQLQPAPVNRPRTAVVNVVIERRQLLSHCCTCSACLYLLVTSFFKCLLKQQDRAVVSIPFHKLLVGMQHLRKTRYIRSHVRKDANGRAMWEKVAETSLRCNSGKAECLKLLLLSVFLLYSMV